MRPIAQMKKLPLLVPELERQGKRLERLLRAAHLNTMTWPEFQELVRIVDCLKVNLADFNVRHFGPQIPIEQPKKKPRSAK